MGVSAENQRNLSVRNSVSYFKNLLGRTFKDPYVSSQQKNVGADIVEMKDGKLGYKVGEKTYLGEQVLAMRQTKVRTLRLVSSQFPSTSHRPRGWLCLTQPPSL